MNYNNIVFFIGDENLYELIFNTPRGWKCRNLETKTTTFINKSPIHINETQWSGISINELFSYIQENNKLNSPLNDLLNQRALKWFNLLKKNNVEIPKKEEIIESVIEEPILEIVEEEKPKKRTRKKKD
jgi:hypothetical protein